MILILILIVDRQTDRGFIIWIGSCNYGDCPAIVHLQFRLSGKQESCFTLNPRASESNGRNWWLNGCWFQEQRLWSIASQGRIKGMLQLQKAESRLFPFTFLFYSDPQTIGQFSPTSYGGSSVYQVQMSLSLENTMTGTNRNNSFLSSRCLLSQVDIQNQSSN